MLVVETLHLTSDRKRPRVPLGSRVAVAVAAVVLLGGAGAAASALADEGAAGGLLGVVLVLLAILACVFAVMASAAGRTGRLVVQQTSRSLLLPGATGVWRLALALLGLTTLLAVAGTVGIGVVLGMGQVDVGASTLGGAVILLAMSVILVLVVAQVLRGKIRVPHLELDADGLTHHGVNADTTVLWRDLTGVRLVADPGRRLLIQSSGTQARVARSSTPGERPVSRPRVVAGEVSLSAAFLGSDAAVVADLVAELAGDPRKKTGLVMDLRAGLATGAFLDDLRRRSGPQG